MKKNKASGKERFERARLLVDGGKSITEACEAEGLHTSQYYYYAKKFSSNAPKLTVHHFDKPAKRSKSAHAPTARVMVIVANAQDLAAVMRGVL